VKEAHQTADHGIQQIPSPCKDRTASPLQRTSQQPFQLELATVVFVSDGAAAAVEGLKTAVT